LGHQTVNSEVSATQRREFMRCLIESDVRRIGAQFTWINGETRLAAAGLSRSGIDGADAEPYLGIIERRVGSQRTGSRWLVESLGHMRGEATLAERLTALTASTVKRQRENKPVSEIMKKDPVTVSPDTSILDAMALMRDHKIAALPVVKDGRLMGIITERDFMNMAAELLCEQLDRFKD